MPQIKSSASSNYELEKLKQLGETIDLYWLSGAGTAQIPVLAEFIAFAEAFESFMLKAWNADEKSAGHALLQVEFRNELRSKSGIVQLFAHFSQALADALPDAEGYSDDPWKAYVQMRLTEAALFAGYDDKAPPLFRILAKLLQLEPQQMILQFLRVGSCSNYNDMVALPKAAAGKGLPLADAFAAFISNGDEDALWSVLKNSHASSSGGVMGLFSFFEAEFGSGEKGRGRKSFRLKGLPASRVRQLSPLYGLDEHYNVIKSNFKHFLAGQKAHHVLLWGFRGAGKSSCVLKLASEFASAGVRLVDYPATMIGRIEACFTHLERFKEKFIVFIDDLSFDNEDGSYRQLKSSLDGGVHGRGANFLIHATTNRRELVDVREQFLDERTDKSHVLDEKRAMDDRFGLKVFFDSPQFDGLRDMLLKIASEDSPPENPDQLYADFQRFCRENRHTQPGGRSIRQFLSSQPSKGQ